jgi:hypothetical protein
MKRKITLDGSFYKSTVLLSLFLTALLFASCEKEDNQEPVAMSADNNARLSPETMLASGDEIAAVPKSLVPEEAMVYINHGACMGSCPAYTVALMSDGNVLYSGYRNVGTVGTVKLNVGRDVAERISSEIIKSGFLDLQDLYPASGPDAVRTVTALRIGLFNADDNVIPGDKLKVVVDYGYRVPPVLAELRMRIENQLGIDRLVKADAATTDLPAQTQSSQ